MGSYTDIPASAGWLARLVFLGILGLVAVLERLQHGLKDSESSRWWASNGRDVLNLFAWLVLALGLTLLGFQGPLVALISAAMVVLLTAIQGLFGRGTWSNVFALGLTFLLGLPAIAFPHRLAEASHWALETLAP